MIKKPKNVYVLRFLLGMFALSGGLLAGTDKPTRNVVVIFCDDLGYGELPCYRNLYQGSEKCETAIGSFTPNIDRLAREGVFFTRAYAHNWCAPSRQVLLTGLWHTRKSAYAGQPWLGRTMKNLGLRTAQFGKYHGDGEKTITLPYRGANTEFDEYFGFEAMIGYYHKAADYAKSQKNGKFTYRVDDKNPKYLFSDEGDYLTDNLSDLAVDFITRCAQQNRPFFLYVPYNAPHTPIQAKAEDLRLLFPEQFGNKSDKDLERPGGKNSRQYIQAMMYAVDRGVGDIMSTLEKLGQLNNTLIIFTSDNDGEENLSLTYPLYGYKHETFEGGTRVPFILWSNDIRTSPSKPKGYDGLVSLSDVLPTALKYVNPAANLQGLRTDGTDIMPYVLGAKPPLKGRLFYTTRTLTKNSNNWDFGKDTADKTEGYCQTLFMDDYKVTKVFQDKNDLSRFHYVFKYVPDMVGKPSPAAALKEDYYTGDNLSPEIKEKLLKKLEDVTADPDLSLDWSALDVYGDKSSGD